MTYCLKHKGSSVHIFGTFDEKDREVSSQLNWPVIEKKTRQEVEQFAIKKGFTKEQINKAKAQYKAQQAGTSSTIGDDEVKVLSNKAHNGRQTRSTTIKKEKSTPSVKLVMKRKEKVAKADKPEPSKGKKAS